MNTPASPNNSGSQSHPPGRGRPRTENFRSRAANRRRFVQWHSLHTPDAPIPILLPMLPQRLPSSTQMATPESPALPMQRATRSPSPHKDVSATKDSRLDQPPQREIDDYNFTISPAYQPQPDFSTSKSVPDVGAQSPRAPRVLLPPTSCYETNAKPAEPEREVPTARFQSPQLTWFDIPRYNNRPRRHVAPKKKRAPPDLLGDFQREVPPWHRLPECLEPEVPNAVSEKVQTEAQEDGDDSSDSDLIYFSD
ncbi:uncharacterized protein E0L32_005926 [Thyridium curvatum]|uniref:Uncharacterized protein n=1 Tax=Thyridium curvatum TaxID=1093900 RepID=A0A507B1H5_9PEZI|nr:uncharacterized protein E0L32_005926 [Thyridium curvatum]TPX13723.1 hypothetical protein E0L32_005926 [Thyridium curvatum]